MKILELRSENFKRLVAVQVTPDGSLVQITGRNGHGKSSLLDSIAVAIGGKALVPKKPIRTGQKKATIKLTLGDKEVELIVTRVFRADKDGDGYTTSLTVESPDGGIFRSPQKMLDELIGALSFDPLEFARAKPADQVDMLRTLVPDFDFDQADAQNAAYYEQRRDINRRRKELEAQAQAIDLPAGDIAAVDETALVEALEAAGKHNADIETRRANRERLSMDADGLDKNAETHLKHAADLLERAEKAKQAAADAKAESDGIRKKLAQAEALPDPIETAAIREKIAAARKTNEAVALKSRKESLEQESAELEQESGRLSERMEGRNQEKAQAIASANLPVPGLSFGSGEVELAGVPFEQGSDAEQLRASVAIAAALNPKLRVIRIRDGSLLDEDGMKLVAEMAEAQDMQIWCERVDSSGKVGFVIEDGHLKAEEDSESAA